MSISKSNHRTKIPFLFVLLIFGTQLIRGQSEVHRYRPNNLVAAQEFLWLMYPDLKGNRHHMAFYLHGSFDDPAEEIAFFRLNVGQYAEGSVASSKNPANQLSMSPCEGCVLVRRSGFY